MLDWLGCTECTTTRKQRPLFLNTKILIMKFRCSILLLNNTTQKPSRGGLEVEAINSLYSASVGSNPAWVWYIDRLLQFKLQVAGGCNAFTILKVVTFKYCSNFAILTILRLSLF